MHYKCFKTFFSFISGMLQTYEFIKILFFVTKVCSLPQSV